STVMVKTRSSGSSGFGQAQLKDFVIAPFALSTPPTANAGTDQAVCANANTPTAFDLSGTCSSGNCSWSQVSGPTVTFGDTSLCATPATFSGAGTAVLRLTCCGQGRCSATDDVSLKINAIPTATAGDDQAECANGNTATAFNISGTCSSGN